MAKGQSSVGNVLFRFFWWVVQLINPRWSHRLMYWGLRDGAFQRQPANDPALQINLWGHSFRSPIGIGEGVDKKGNVLDSLISMGYSFGEFGPYTLEREMPEKRMHYLKKEKAVVTLCRGYRNPGIMRILPWFVKRRYLPHYVGVDVAIPTDSEEQNIKQGRHFTYQEEFVLMAQKLSPYCDYITLNFSHPNSELAMMIVDAASIVPIIKSVKEAVRLAAPIQTPPVLVKVPLDITIQEVPLVVQNLLEGGADGVIIGGPLSLDKNTKVLPETAPDIFQNGMMFGGPLQERIFALIAQFYRQSQGRLPIVAYGSVFTPEDAFRMIGAGASLIQLDSTCLTYAGPAVVFNIHKGLIRLLTEKGFSSIEKAVGCDLRVQMDVSTPVQAPVSQSGFPNQPNQ
jgi:dihydroorotate dehydrogenase